MFEVSRSNLNSHHHGVQSPTASQRLMELVAHVKLLISSLMNYLFYESENTWIR